MFQVLSDGGYIPRDFLDINNFFVLFGSLEI